MRKSQPEDEWTFLGVDDFIDDGEIEDLDAAMDLAAEEVAMHVEDPEHPQALSKDPASSDTGVDVDDDSPIRVARFDDEQPESGEPDDTRRDHEPEISEILESQNLLFDDSDEETDDGNVGNFQS